MFIRKLYDTRFGEEDIGNRILLWEVLTRHFFGRIVPSEGCLLELGSGGCEFINAITAAKKIAIDCNPEVENRAASNVRCIIADLVEGLGQLENDSVDCVMASNVFEHLPDKDVLYRCLSESHRVLKPGGRLIVMQPNIAAVRERFYDFADHSLPLTEKGMAEIIRSCGFEIDRVVARFLPYTTKSRYPSWPFLVRLYLLFPPIHRIMGGQMLILARKPAH